MIFAVGTLVFNLTYTESYRNQLSRIFDEGWIEDEHFVDRLSDAKHRNEIESQQNNTKKTVQQNVATNMDSSKSIKVENDASAVLDEKIGYQNQLKQLNLQKLGLILSRLCIFAISFILIVTVGQVVTFVVLGIFDLILLLALFVVSVASLGIIYAVNPNFAKNIMDTVDNTNDTVALLSNFLAKITTYLPIVIAVMISSGVLSIILLSKFSTQNHKAKNIVLIIAMSIVTLVAIVTMIAVGGAK